MKLSVLLQYLLVSSLVRISHQCSLSSIAKGRCPPDGSDPTACTLRPDDDACPYNSTSILLHILVQLLPDDPPQSLLYLLPDIHRKVP